MTSPDKGSVVPAHRLLEAAGALSEGATALHDQLRHLEPSESDAVVQLVADQVTEIVKMWAELVRGVVDSDDSVGREEPRRSSATRTPPFAHYDQREHAGDHPARLAPGDAPVDPQPLFRREAASIPSEGERLTRDELTGVLNRQAGFAALGRETDRCQRGGERFVLGYLNVDGLKVVNDTRGPRGGDELLRKVAAALRATLRSYDVIMRLGGDEFLFSLPGTDVATAELRFKEFAAILSEESPGTSASVGFAELHQHDSLDDLIAEAEAAMLKGRRTRRRGRG
jgi:diguanylate cyclase (GGDEF)-like protein